MEKTTAKILQLPYLKDLILEQDEIEIFDFIEFPFWKPTLEKVAWCLRYLKIFYF